MGRKRGAHTIQVHNNIIFVYSHINLTKRNRIFMCFVCAARLSVCACVCVQVKLQYVSSVFYFATINLYVLCTLGILTSVCKCTVCPFCFSAYAFLFFSFKL